MSNNLREMFDYDSPDVGETLASIAGHPGMAAFLPQTQLHKAYSVATYQPTDLYYQLFLEGYTKPELYVRADSLTYKGTYRSLIEGIVEDIKQEYGPGAILNILFSSAQFVTIRYGTNFHISIKSETNRSFHDEANGTYHLSMSGEPDHLTRLSVLWRTKFVSSDKQSTIDWWFVTDKQSYEMAEIILVDDHKTIYPAFYPWLISEETPEPLDFMRQYQEAEEPILFLSGPPGTGKTTLLRRSLLDFGVNAVIAYEESLFKSDQMFLSFLRDPDKDWMIIEDADNLVTSREQGNNIVSRFLNTSDGIVRFPKKKIIFTTNLSVSDSHIDEALMRPGRCFAFVQFRNLTNAETLTACQVANLKMPGDDKDNYSLAEIFNNHNSHKYIKRKVGFV